VEEVSRPGKIMKFLLTVFICSVASGDCYTNNTYPKVFNNHHDCIRAGLSESYEVLFAEGNFTEEQINKMQLYPKFHCNPVKDEGKVTT
jgi:hypothetical protein